MFTRTFCYQTNLPKQAIKNKLVGNHLNIHNLDFEVLEKNESLRIVPHAETVEDIKTLPISWVEIDENNGRTKVKVTSRMRRFDIGGPMLILILCGLLMTAAAILALLRERLPATILFSSSLLTYIIFRLRLEKGYFDYVRKVQSHVLNAGYYTN